VAPHFEGRYTYVVCNVMWIATVLLNPVIYLLFNRCVEASFGNVTIFAH